MDKIKQMIKNVNNVKIKLFRNRKKLAAMLKTKLEPAIINKYEKHYGIYSNIFSKKLFE